MQTNLNCALNLGIGTQNCTFYLIFSVFLSVLLFWCGVYHNILIQRRQEPIELETSGQRVFFWGFCGLSWLTSILCKVGELAGRGSVSVAVGVGYQ